MQDKLYVNFKRMAVYVNKTEVRLTLTEYRLLCFFLTNINVAFSKAEIVKEIWDYETEDYRNLETHIKTLRKKIKPYNKYLITIYCYGYCFTECNKITFE